MKRRPILLAVLTMTASACAAPATDPAARPATGTMTEMSCIDTSRIADTVVRDDRTIDFVLQEASRPVFRNILAQDCPLLGIERTFAWESTGNRLCRGNPIQVLQNGRPIPGPTCALGRFSRIAPPAGDGRNR